MPDEVETRLVFCPAPRRGQCEYQEPETCAGSATVTGDEK